MLGPRDVSWCSWQSGSREGPCPFVHSWYYRRKTRDSPHLQQLMLGLRDLESDGWRALLESSKGFLWTLMTQTQVKSKFFRSENYKRGKKTLFLYTSPESHRTINLLCLPLSLYSLDYLQRPSFLSPPLLSDAGQKGRITICLEVDDLKLEEDPEDL